ncbi:MAG: CCA tRNA nucleotidyltransferase [Candidatus Bathyarchaeota archaeon]|nr:CCA tRNA nucleotidyltransferase [Candidatus Bathyarchaeota archaeon]MDW8041132.1 CCA tRNA nucleotidyltransferase [Nitrososphaerota archaeon]
MPPAQDTLGAICKTVLERITPKPEEREKIEGLAKALEKKVAKAAEHFGVKATVRLEGSVAKDTWLSGEPDIDIFMRLPPNMPRSALGEVALKIARKATEGAKQVERFAEHPYLEAFLDEVRVNIVPCYKTQSGEWLSATDRTPYHTDYVKRHLKPEMRGEVRLLKKFMKGIGVYGAEIKVGGFSGYLCELLVIHYGSFLNVLEAFAQPKQRMVVDIEKHYKGREDELPLLFNEPLVMIDPVDMGRNVASAVQPQKFYTFVAAARAFLEKPSLKFFYPPETAPLTVEKLKETLKKRGSAMLFIVFGEVDAVPDILWGQLYKSQRSLAKLLETTDFALLRHAVWSDEEKLNVLIFELESRQLSPLKRHLGPPLDKLEDSRKFLAKHVASPETVSGPYIEGGRWTVEIKRKYTDAVSLLGEKLKDGGRNAGVAKKIAQALSRGFKILVNEEIAETYAENIEFAKFLTDFLQGKPKWL